MEEEKADEASGGEVGADDDAQSMTALLLFPREQRTSIWPTSLLLFPREQRTSIRERVSFIERNRRGHLQYQARGSR